MPCVSYPPVQAKRKTPKNNPQVRLSDLPKITVQQLAQFLRRIGVNYDSIADLFHRLPLLNIIGQNRSGVDLWLVF
jgi:hypothetical protein